MFLGWLRRAVLLAQGALAVAALALLAAWPGAQFSRAEPPHPEARLDPAAWGEDHVDQELPEYMEGGECLFCHRTDVGSKWAKNAHNRTIRDAEPDSREMKALVDDPQTRGFADEIDWVMGDRRAARYLQRGEKYGHADLLSVVAEGGRGGRFRLAHTDAPHWDTEHFAKRCAGCHATAVDPELQAYTTVAHDCYVCHGDASLDHTNDPSLMPLAKERHDPPRVVVSVCGSCHIRFGRSKASGLPYPTNFVAGDNLFRDFEVDFGLADDERVNPSDRHVLANIRDVVLYGREEMTCLTCHDVHGDSSAKHRDVPDQAYCALCHDPSQPKSKHLTYEVHSKLCEY